ncbi:beta strand repeat-containing protein [Variovorax sp. PAMC26660]|uniref:beta strand repeat-containing protein n=1 Tax=Variovorax sp. PAMC26660 TaxID=2762322 RepID=UPI00164D4C98|nr:Ig-like domain-containing protein [Variovorax sp. PAMC26660]QNK65424.1 Ig-like domain-containing protein [Variovorax sp. PAMC26660]
MRSLRWLWAGALALSALSLSAPASAAQVACTPQTAYNTCVQITYNGADQPFTVPAGVSAVLIKAWGAGGGGPNTSYYTAQRGGGGGGFATGTLAVTPASTLGIRVGQGGRMNDITGVFGGGGAGGNGANISRGASGGGLSGVFLSASYTQGNARLIAGAGGGSSPGADVGTPSGAGGGGLVGGSDGTSGSGKGGTQSAGGAAGSGGSCNLGSATGGGALQGGQGASTNQNQNEGGGGGGGGYFGGGGGICQGTDPNGMGGGGSSYLAPALTGSSTVGGSNSASDNTGGAAANSGDAHYVAGVAAGGGGNASGGNGLVVIQYNLPMPVLTLGKTAPSTVVQSGAMTYTLSLTNNGTAATGTTVIVRDRLPTGVRATAVAPGANVTSVNCGTMPSANAALLSCTMTLPAGGIPIGETRSFTLTATAPATVNTVVTNYASAEVDGNGVPATNPSASCVSNATVSCASASTTVVGPAAPARSGERTVTDNMTANGTDQDVLEAIVRDASNNQLPGIVVTFAATPGVAFNGGAIGAAGSCTTDASGLCSVTATSTIAGTKSSVVSTSTGVLTGSFTLNGKSYGPSPASYTFVVGTPSAAQSGLRVATDNQLANGIAKDVLQVYVRDASGNPVGAGVVVNFGATPNVAFGTGAVGAAGSCTTTSASQCDMPAASTVPGSYATTAVTLGGVELGGSFTAGGNTYQPSPQPYRFGALPTVTIQKTSLNGTGTFDFTGTNGLTAQSITTLLANTPTSAPTQTLAAAGTVTTITEGVPPAGFSLTTAACTGMGAGGTATLSGRVLTLNAAATAPGSNLVCTFTNTGLTGPTSPPIPPTVSCATNAAVFNTAYAGPNGPPLSGGRDSVWESGEGSATGGPGSVAAWQRSFVGNKAPGAWINSPFSNANWNSNYDPSHAGNVDVYHRFTFNMDGTVNPGTFSLKLDFYSDNSVAEVFVNGMLQSVPGVPQGGADPYNFTGYKAGQQASATLSSNWRTGSNTVVVHVKSGPPNEGFLAQATTAAVCVAPTVALSKTTTGGAGGPFNFTLSNTTQTNGVVSTMAAGTAVQVDGNTVAAGTQPFSATAAAAPITITEPAVPGWNLASALCTDAGTPIGSLGSGANARTYTIPAESVQYGKPLQCLFTNAASATVTISKVSNGGTGAFGFTGSNGLAAQTITTATAGTAVAGAIQTLAAPGVATTVTEDVPPANYALIGVSCTGLGAGGTATPDLPNRKVTLDAAATAAGSNIACTFTNTFTPPYPKVRIVKTTTGGSGANVFGFALSGLSASTDSITVTGADTVSGAANLTGTAGLEATIKESAPAGWPANPISASCVDAASATPTTPFGTLVGNQLTLPAARMVAGADISCTFVNGFGYSVSGRVFLDNGIGTGGTANDGLINGAEGGIAGVPVRLTNCGATVISTATTDGGGSYALDVPFGTAANTPLCVEQTNTASRLSTGASFSSVRLPSGSAVASGGTTYTYTRAGTPDRIAFTWNGSGHAGLNFGDVERNTLAADGAKSGLPGSTVSYAHTFIARTGGTVSFSISSSVDTPAIGGWSGKIFADTGCTGSLQPGAALLYPPSAPVTVVAGQNVCLLMQEFIPASAGNGNNNRSTVQASFDFTNAGPALSASYTVLDITTVSNSALELKKEVRNVTQGGSFGVNNQAKSGETLEYRVTYINNGMTPITGMTVNDTTPQYTAFVAAQAGTTPASLTGCSKNTPANAAPAPAVACAAAQTVGGTGGLRWAFGGSLAPGGTGEVLFSVKVD